MVVQAFRRGLVENPKGLECNLEATRSTTTKLI
jgi:hypothetical protein